MGLNRHCSDGGGVSLAAAEPGQVLVQDDGRKSIVERGLRCADNLGMIRLMDKRVKLRKREIVLAIGAGLLAATAATGILSDGFGGPGSSFKNVPGLGPPDPSENPRR